MIFHFAREVAPLSVDRPFLASRAQKKNARRSTCLFLCLVYLGRSSAAEPRPETVVVVVAAEGPRRCWPCRVTAPRIRSSPRIGAVFPRRVDQRGRVCLHRSRSSRSAAGRTDGRAPRADCSTDVCSSNYQLRIHLSLNSRDCLPHESRSGKTNTEIAAENCY